MKLGQGQWIILFPSRTLAVIILFLVDEIMCAAKARR
jgi:hypothetical protein